MRAETIKLDEENILSDPFEQFRFLYETARSHIDTKKADVMCLSTVDQNGYPDSRYVLLKGFDHNGFIFFTDLRSSKARQLSARPAAALALYWEPIGVQIRIQGKAALLAPERVTEYFITRPRESRLGAWASEQSSILKGRKPLEERLRTYINRFLNMSVPRPPHWGGYRIVPYKFEFWKERASRLHDRFLYTRSENGWKIERLSP